MKKFEDLKKPIGEYQKLMIEVYYSLGGANYFHGTTNPRGYKVSLTPCNQSNGILSKTLLGGQHESGFFITLEATKRKNQKRLEQWQAKIAPLTEKMTELYEAKEYAEIQKLVLLS